jgi:hypothetical protein
MGGTMSTEKYSNAEQVLSNVLQEMLQDMNVTFEVQPEIGPSVTADLIAHDKSNNAYIVEIKGGGQGHHLSMSAIAQAKGTADFMAGSGVYAQPIVYTDMDVSPVSQHAAEAMGVQILYVHNASQL